MNDDVRALQEALRSLAGTGSMEHQGSSAYSGSPHTLLGIATPELRRLAKGWLAENKALANREILTIVDRLIAGPIHDEKTLGTLLLGYAPGPRSVATPSRLDAWLDTLVGWAEIDALCSNVFQQEDFIADWPAYGPYLRRLAADPNVNKRRASLVLLTGPVRKSDDLRLADAAFANIHDLQHERSILITKAVSWLLRNLLVRHREAVTLYLQKNRAALPAIAVREVSAKLEIGRKNRTRH